VGLRFFGQCAQPPLTQRLRFRGLGRCGKYFVGC
jgi:hypothetical protein